MKVVYALQDLLWRYACVPWAHAPTAKEAAARPLFKKRLHKAIDIFSVTRIESAQFQTCADMYLYEIYYINTLHPMLNRDDAAPDELTVTLPEVPFIEFECCQDLSRN